MFISLLSIVIVLNSCRAESSDLEKFLTSGFNKDTSNDSQAKGNNTGTTVNDLVQFMRRAGLLTTNSLINNQQNTLQTQSAQQPSTFYIPQQSQLTSYVAPKRQLEVPQQQQQQPLALSTFNTASANTLSKVTNFASSDPVSNQQNTLQIQSPQQPSSYYLPQQSRLTSYVAPKRQLEVPQQQQQQSLALSNTASKVTSYASSDPKQDDSTKTVAKADRQGLYAQDGLYDNGYTGNHGSYISSNDRYTDNHGGGYSADHYVPEPIYPKTEYPKLEYPKPEYYPPSVAIKIDPIGILRLILQGIPRPLLNLNGKVFFGVELGKNGGLVKGAYAPPKLYSSGGYAAQPHGGVTTYALG